MSHGGKCAAKTAISINRDSEKVKGVKQPTNSWSTVFASACPPSRIGGRIKSCGSCSFAESMEAATNEGQKSK